jgi:hypothetical protein
MYFIGKTTLRHKLERRMLMESNVEKKVEWQPIGVGPATYSRRIERAIEGLSASSTSEDRKFHENLPNLAVECLMAVQIAQVQAGVLAEAQNGLASNVVAVIKQFCSQ